MSGSWRFLVVCGWVGCSGDSTADKSEPGTTDTPTDVGTTDDDPSDSALDSRTGPEPDYVPTLPTDITDPCWSWGFQTEDGAYSGEYLTINAPDTFYNTHYEADYDPDGEIDYAYDRAFEANGQDWTWMRYDDDGDGVYDDTRTYEYDAMGLRSRFIWDQDGDGVNDEVWTYDYVGGLRSVAYVDEGDDGTIDQWLRYTYDAVDRPILVEVDEGNDGVIEELYTWTYVDPTGPDFDYTVDANADGVPEDLYFYGYDADERLIRYTSDLEDGSYQEVDYTYAYPAPSEDRSLQVGRYMTADYPPYSYRIEWTYEGPGKASTVFERYETDDGAYVFEYETEYTWTCP